MPSLHIDLNEVHVWALDYTLKDRRSESDKCSRPTEYRVGLHKCQKNSAGEGLNRRCSSLFAQTN